jgi:hypothetical protein
MSREEFNAIELVPLSPSEKDTERRERRNWPVRAGDFGPCKYCFNGMIYDDSSGSLKLRRVNRDEIMNSKISSPGRLSIRSDDPTAHVAKDWEATITVIGLDITEGTPEKNQQKLTMEAWAEASRLVSKDAVTEFICATFSLSFEGRRDLYLALFSNGSDEDKRNLILPLKTKAGAITSQMMDKVVEIRDEVIPRWSAMQAQVGLEVRRAEGLT